MTNGEAAAVALEQFALWIDGGTPRAWENGEHPCYPGVPVVPTEIEKERMMIADTAREAAAYYRKGGAV